MSSRKIEVLTTLHFSICIGSDARRCGIYDTDVLLAGGCVSTVIGRSPSTDESVLTTTKRLAVSESDSHVTTVSSPVAEPVSEGSVEPVAQSTTASAGQVMLGGVVSKIVMI